MNMLEPCLMLPIALTLASSFGCNDAEDGAEGLTPPAYEAGPGHVMAGDAGSIGMLPGQLPGGPSATADAGGAGNGSDAAAGRPDAAGPTPAQDAGAPGAAQDAGSQPVPGGVRILPPVDDVNKDGPFQPTIDTKPDFVVFRPVELGKGGLKHPVFVWGTGAGALPERYNDHFNRMASHGFVIVSPNKTQKSGADMKAALEFILGENEKDGSPYYQKLDPERVAMGGHSQGSTSTFDAEASEMRLKTTIHIAGGSFDGQGSSKVKTPTAYICGETDIALSNCRRDFMNVKDQPTFFSVLTGVDHVQCAREALPGMIAWLRWHLAGETERAKQFAGPDGDFFKGIWKSEAKNWSY